VAVVSVVSAHSTLAAIQDTEALVVCGTPTAAPPPQCLTAEQHRAFAAKLAVAFDLDEKIATEVRAWPPGAAVPPVLSQLLGHLKALVSELLGALPAVPVVERLRVTVQGGQP
jgi:hypothetical protein